MTAPAPPTPEQVPAQAPVPAPAPAQVPVPAPAAGDQVWPPPDEEMIRIQMASRFSIIEEPGGVKADGADQGAVAPPGTTAPAPPAAEGA